MIHEDMAEHAAEQVAELVYSESAGGNVFIDALPSEPDQCVAVFAAGGMEADSGLPYDAPVVQFMVRSTANPAWGLAVAQKLYDLFHGLANKTLTPTSTYLVFALGRQSGPVRVGADEQGRHRYSVNFRTEVLNTAGSRSNDPDPS